MAETQRTLAATLQRIDDILQNSSDMDTQFLRDILEYARPQYGMVHATGSAVATVLADTSTPVEIAPVVTLDALAYNFDTPAAGRLRYTGTNPVVGLVTCSMSVIAATVDDVLNFRLGISGTADATLLQTTAHKIAADQQAITLTAVMSLAQNEYISAFVVNETEAANVTVEDFQLSFWGRVL